jgi:hypothetical protein
MTYTRGRAAWLDSPISDTLQGAKHQHTETGQDSPAKLHRAHLANGEELGRAGQPDRVNDDDRCERGVW